MLAWRAGVGIYIARVTAHRDTEVDRDIDGSDFAKSRASFENRSGSQLFAVLDAGAVRPAVRAWSTATPLWTCSAVKENAFCTLRLDTVESELAGETGPADANRPVTRPVVRSQYR